MEGLVNTKNEEVVRPINVTIDGSYAFYVKVESRWHGFDPFAAYEYFGPYELHIGCHRLTTFQ